MLIIGLIFYFTDLTESNPFDFDDLCNVIGRWFICCGWIEILTIIVALIKYPIH